MLPELAPAGSRSVVAAVADGNRAAPGGEQQQHGLPRSAAPNSEPLVPEWGSGTHVLPGVRFDPMLAGLARLRREAPARSNLDRASELREVHVDVAGGSGLDEATHVVLESRAPAGIRHSACAEPRAAASMQWRPRAQPEWTSRG